jgi:hypothetical protein
VGQVMVERASIEAPFNGPVEIGLRCLCILVACFPSDCSLQRLVICDYLVVHSDDFPQGPPGLHPKTPHRSGELLVRRNAIRQGILLYASRGLVERVFRNEGMFYTATEESASFLDALEAKYIEELRDRANWIAEQFSATNDAELLTLTNGHLGKWGAEFVRESVLWSEDDA